MKCGLRNLHAFGVLLMLSCTPLVLARQPQQHPKRAPLAVEIRMIPSDEAMLPANFQVALYENLIDQLQKKRVFEALYRDGDQNARMVSDLTTLECTVTKLKKGSETLREMTTVIGATSMTLRCELMDQEGNSFWVREIKGHVRFFGENLKATVDFAKKTANLMEKDF